MTGNKDEKRFDLVKLAKQAEQEFPITLQLAKTIITPVAAMTTGASFISAAILLALYGPPTYIVSAMAIVVFCLGIALYAFLLTGGIRVEQQDGSISAWGGCGVFVLLLLIFFTALPWTGGKSIADRSFETRQKIAATDQKTN